MVYAFSVQDQDARIIMAAMYQDRARVALCQVRLTECADGPCH